MARGDTRSGRIEQVPGSAAPARRGGSIPCYHEELVYMAPASPATAVFFMNNRPVTGYVYDPANSYEVTDVSEIHSTAGTDAGAVTIDITIDRGTAAPGAGNSVLAATFNAKGTANTRQVATLSATLANRQLAPGDRLAVKYTGVLTALAGVLIVVSVKKL